MLTFIFHIKRSAPVGTHRNEGTEPSFDTEKSPCIAPESIWIEPVDRRVKIYEHCDPQTTCVLGAIEVRPPIKDLKGNFTLEDNYPMPKRYNLTLRNILRKCVRSDRARRACGAQATEPTSPPRGW